MGAYHLLGQPEGLEDHRGQQPERVCERLSRRRGLLQRQVSQERVTVCVCKPVSVSGTFVRERLSGRSDLL